MKNLNTVYYQVISLDKGCKKLRIGVSSKVACLEEMEDIIYLKNGVACIKWFIFLNFIKSKANKNNVSYHQNGNIITIDFSENLGDVK